MIEMEHNLTDYGHHHNDPNNANCLSSSFSPSAVEHERRRNSSGNIGFVKNESPSLEEDFPHFCHCSLRHYPGLANARNLSESNEKAGLEEDFPHFCHCSSRHYLANARTLSESESNLNYLLREETKPSKMKNTDIQLNWTMPFHHTEDNANIFHWDWDTPIPFNHSEAKNLNYEIPFNHHSEAKTSNGNMPFDKEGKTLDHGAHHRSCFRAAAGLPTPRRCRSFEHLTIMNNDGTPMVQQDFDLFHGQRRHYSEAADARNLHESNPDFQSEQDKKATKTHEKYNVTRPMMLKKCPCSASPMMHQIEYSHKDNQRRRNVSENLAFSENHVPSMEENFPHYSQDTVRHYSDEADARNQHEHESKVFSF